MPAPRLLALLAVVVSAYLPATAAATTASAAHPRAHAAASHHSHARCSGHRRGRHPRGCPAVRRKAAAGHAGARSRQATGSARHHRRSSHATTGSSGLPTSAGLPTAGTAAGVPASAAPCANTDLIPTADNLTVVQTATLCLINQVRAQHGLRALTPNADLQSAAVRHDTDMVTQDYFEHTGPGGDTPMSRIQDSGYLANPGNGYEIGENIAWGTGTDATPQAIVQAWVNSPEHLANILDANYRDSGLAAVAQAPASVSGGAAGAIYTQDFGGIDSSTS